MYVDKYLVLGNCSWMLKVCYGLVVSLFLVLF